MNAQELRIGNCIWDVTKDHVKFVNNRVIWDLSDSPTPLPYLPIKLTPEIFKDNCGFKNIRDYRESNGLYRMSNGIFAFDYKDNQPIIIYNEAKRITQVINLHHFQNWYYTETLVELEIINSHKIRQ